MSDTNRKYPLDYSQSENFWKADDPKPIVHTAAPVLPSRKPVVRAEVMSGLRGALDAVPQPGVIQIGAAHRTDHSGHARSDDNAVSIAMGSLLYGASYGLIFAGVLLALGLLAVFGLGYDGVQVSIGAFILWGAVTMFALNRNRAQGLRHSPTGVALAQTDADENVRHHQIDSNERVELEKLGLARDIARGFLTLLEKNNEVD